MVDSWHRTAATIALTTRSGRLIRFLAGWQGPVIALALMALAPTAQGYEPLFTYAPANPTTNQFVTFTATDQSQPDSEHWDLDGDRICDDWTGATAQRSFAVAGAYQVTLCVTGEHMLSDTTTVTVLNQPPVPAFTYAPSSPLVGERVTFASISADPDGPIVSQAWDLDADGVFDDGTGPTAAWTFAEAGDHLVRLQVTDRDGAVAVAQATIPVAERPAALLRPFPIVRMTASLTSRGTRIHELVVNAPDGARVQVRCRGRRCPFRSFARMADVQARAARTVRIRRLARYVLPPGTLIEIRVTKRGEVGKYTRFRIRKGEPPVRVDRCLPPGARRPAPCPG